MTSKIPPPLPSIEKQQRDLLILRVCDKLKDPLESLHRRINTLIASTEDQPETISKSKDLISSLLTQHEGIIAGAAWTIYQAQKKPSVPTAETGDANADLEKKVDYFKFISLQLFNYSKKTHAGLFPGTDFSPFNIFRKFGRSRNPATQNKKGGFTLGRNAAIEALKTATQDPQFSTFQLPNEKELYDSYAEFEPKMEKLKAAKATPSTSVTATSVSGSVSIAMLRPPITSHPPAVSTASTHSGNSLLPPPQMSVALRAQLPPSHRQDSTSGKMPEDGRRAPLYSGVQERGVVEENTQTAAAAGKER